MSFLLLWIELLLVSILLAVAMIAYASRHQSLTARLACYAVGLLGPGFLMSALIILFASLHLWFHLHSTNFWFAAILLMLFLSAFFFFRIRASRRDAAGLPRALSWPVGRLHIAWLVALSLLLMTYWNLALQAQLEIQALRTQAGAMALSVAPPVIPDSENAALIYQQAIQRYNTTATADDRELDYRDLDPRSPRIVDFLQRHQKTLDLIRRAADMPQYRPDYQLVAPSDAQIQAIVNDISPMRALSNTLIVAARAKATDGHADLALDDCRRLYAMSAHIGSAPLLINGLVSVAMDTLASNTTAQVLPAVTAKEQLDHLPVQNPHAISRMFNRCLRSEEAFGLARFCDFGSGDFGDSKQAPPILAAGTWMLWLHDDLTLYMQYSQRTRDLVDLPYFKALPGLKQIEAELQPGSGYPRGPLTAMLFPALTASIRQITTAEALRSCITVSAAATRYRLAHHEYPAKVEMLAPEFLDAIPLDPFDGQPLRYKKDADAITLYSIGPDLADNGGDVAPRKNAKSPDSGYTLKPPP